MHTFARLAAAIILCWRAGAAAAQESVPASVADLAAEVHQVVAGGLWSSGGREGPFRVVVTEGGFEHTRHMLYLQWIALDPDTQDTEIAATAAVEDVNADAAQTIIYRLEPDYTEFGRLRLSVDVARVRANERVEYEIVVESTPGAYTVQRVATHKAD